MEKERKYNRFANSIQRKKFVCKSEINSKLLREFCLENVLTVKEMVEYFESVKDPIKYVKVNVGRYMGQEVYVKFMLKKVLYNGLLDYYFGENSDFPRIIID